MSTTNRIIRPDGVAWHEWQEGSSHVLATDKGAKLRDRIPNLEHDVRLYLGVALGRTAIQPDGVRTFFDNDTNGRVYTLNQAVYGNDLLVKETNGHLMRNALDRLDRIKEIISKQQMEGKIPGWIDVPDHYGMLAGPKLPHQYVLMQGIDSGINVRDVVKFDELNEKERLGVTATLGPISEGLQATVSHGFDRVKSILDNAIAEETGQVPERLLSDWHEGNVVLEQLETPIEGSDFRYWVIDQ